MANPVFHSQYTAAQIEALIANGAPIIGQNGNWYRWNVADMQYEDTGIEADAQAAADRAEAAQAAAENAQSSAENAQDAAEEAQGKAQDAQDAAENAQAIAEAAAESMAGLYLSVADGILCITYEEV